MVAKGVPGLEEGMFMVGMRACVLDLASCKVGLHEDAAWEAAGLEPAPVVLQLLRDKAAW